MCCYRGNVNILSGTISCNFVPDSCVVGTEWYRNVPGTALRIGEFVREAVILGKTQFFVYLWSLIENSKI